MVNRLPAVCKPYLDYIGLRGDCQREDTSIG